MLPLFPLGSVLMPGLVQAAQRLRGALPHPGRGARGRARGVRARVRGGRHPLRSRGRGGRRPCARGAATPPAAPRSWSRSTPWRTAAIEIVSRRVHPVPAARHRRDGRHAVPHGLVERLGESDGDGAPIFARSVARHFDGYRDLLGGDGQVTDPSEPRRLSYLVAAAMRLDLADRQRLLEQPDTAARLRAELALLRRETALVAALPGGAGHRADADALRPQLTQAPRGGRTAAVADAGAWKLGSCQPRPPTKECHMPQTVKGVIARSQGGRRRGRRHRRARPRTRARRSCRSRPAGCATPTCTTARAASTTSSRSCSGTRRPASSRRSARASPTSRPATSSSSTGAPCAASAGPAPRASRWYCFNTHNATQKMTLDRRHRAVARRSASAPSSRRPSSPPASAPRSTPRPTPPRSACSAAA